MIFWTFSTIAPSPSSTGPGSSIAFRSPTNEPTGQAADDAAGHRQAGRPPGGDDSFSRSLLAVVGLGTPGQRGRHEHLEPVMLDFAGFFAHLPRTAIGLERILAEHFGLPIHVLQFQGQWLILEAADRSHLGGSNRPGTANNRLGGNAVLGDGVWDVASRFRIRIGPLQDLAQFYRFLPAAVGDDLQVLRQLVRVYAGPDLEFDVQLVLPAGVLVAGRAGRRSGTLSDARLERLASGRALRSRKRRCRVLRPGPWRTFQLTTPRTRPGGPVPDPGRKIMTKRGERWVLT